MSAEITDASVAVVLMAYGTPADVAGIEPYYTDIRRGRPPTPEALADLTARYAAIGGISPLAARTEAQRAAIESALEQAEPGRFTVALGMKHVEPRVEATARRVVDAGAPTVVGLVLAPHHSSASIGDYLARLRAGVADSARGERTEIVEIESWATEPAFVDFLAADLAARLAVMRSRVDGRVRVMFTAHSLPERVIAGGDDYVDELSATATAVADQLALDGDDWQIAWQSAGRTPEPWIGPDILAVIDELAADAATGGVIVCACGFVADHLEVLYDLDIEAATRAAAAGLAFDRTACVNDDAGVMSALADLVRRRVG